MTTLTDPATSPAIPGRTQPTMTIPTRTRAVSPTMMRPALVKSVTYPRRDLSLTWDETAVNGRERPVNAMNAVAHPVLLGTFVNAVEIGRGDIALLSKITGRAGVGQMHREWSGSACLVEFASSADRQVTDGDPTRESAGTQGVLPDVSPPALPPADLQKDRSGTWGTGSRATPKTARNRGVSGHGPGSLLDTGGGGGRGE